MHSEQITILIFILFCVSNFGSKNNKNDVCLFMILHLFENDITMVWKFGVLFRPRINYTCAMMRFGKIDDGPRWGKQ